jgi:hypothetical protein
MWSKHGRALLAIGLVATAIPGDPAQAQEDELGWPRQFQYEELTVLIYQPQLESFDGDRITGRAAFSVTRDGESGPGFGAFWFDARVETDRDERLVTLVSFEVPRVRGPDLSETQASRAAEIIESEVQSWDMVISLDRILTGLELAEHERAVSADLGTDPPAILFATEPSMLVMLDGQAVLHDIEDTDMRRVVNTPFTIIYEPGAQAYYLYAGEQVWFRAIDVMGPWDLAESTPAEVAALIPPDTVQAAAEDDVDDPVDIERVQILVATEPTELIQSDGPPEYGSIAGTDLLYVVNTESDVFIEIETNKFYVVLAGRWYAAETLEGPWEYVASDSLPDDFQKIPPDSDRGSVLTYVAGTDQAQDAVLDNSIPQTSAVKRDATLAVTYDGEPRFEAIEGTGMQYAVNTEYQVLEIDGRYYACHEAVWYESESPTGPFIVTTTVPDDVQDIPPENPNYNVKYVYVYDYTPEVIYVGYTPGYTWSYVYGPTVVYGTGYWYRPWISPYYYYPRPVTWGFRVSYNPWYGWSFGFGFSYGRFHFGIGGPSYWYGARGWWGPAGYRHGYHHGYRRGYGAGYRAGYRAGQRNANIYNRPSNMPRNVDRATARSQMSQRQRTPTTRPSTGAQPRQPQAAAGRNDVFADRDGNVYRQNADGSWQMRDQQNWSGVDRSQVQGGGGGADRAAQQPSTRDRPAQQPSTRPSTTNRTTTQDRSGNLSREAQNRQRGSARTQNYGSRPRTGGRAGGRGRR